MRGTKTEIVEVEISDHDLFEEAIKRFLLKFGLNPDQYIRDGFIYEDEPARGRPIEHKIGQASRYQVFALEVVAKMRGMLKK